MIENDIKNEFKYAKYLSKEIDKLLEKLSKSIDKIKMLMEN